MTAYGSMGKAAAASAATALAVAVTASACGNGDAKRQPDAAINPATPVPVPVVTSTGANAVVAVNRIVAGLRTHGLESQMSDIRVFTAQTDPAHQLGRPGAYVARATFTDSTLPATARSTSTFVRGGTVEVFTSGDAARADVRPARDAMPGEHDLLSGAVLLRLSPRAPDTLVEKYRTALNETTGTPPQRFG